MAVKPAQVVADSTTPQKLNVAAETDSGGSSNTDALRYGQKVAFFASGAFYIGGASTVTSSGANRGAYWPGGFYSFDISGKDDLYALAGAGTVTFELVQAGV